ncbi:MAG: ATPase [Saprospiraceae bacterium]|nr:ATPase [Saprospiraceae bacterium]
MQSTRLNKHPVPDSVLQEYRRIQTLITQSDFNYDHFVKLMEIHGKIMYGQSFKLFQEDNHVLLQFYAYFTGDQSLCKHYDINLNKGLFLSGKTGVGKTVHMKLVRQFLGYKDRFKMKPCQQLSLEYMDQGSPVLMQFGRNYVDHIDHNTINTSYCFDDLGTEDEVKHYGTQTNAMAQVILMRYNLFQARQILTHFTSNLTADQIELHYGDRVRSRLREMCNWIEYTTDSKDKRI